MTYEETIERIHGLARFGSKLGLERMGELMNRLGNPQDKMKVIHVAGTNGKGSVCRYIYSILRENGYKVGLYTSPFLMDFNERIEFDGKEISREDLAFYGQKVFQKVDEITGEGFDSPTEFEVVTAIGFCYFIDRNIDLLVLEVGLGGTGDSTNIIKNPVACVITSISFDHMGYLGDTLEAIAGEKAGIIKNYMPVISNVKDEKAAIVIKNIASDHNCSFYGYPLNNFTNVNKSLDFYSFDLENLKGVEISMIGVHQIENAICALTVADVLEKKNIVKLQRKKVLGGIKKAKQIGRLEVMSKDPIIIIDGAHNQGGAESLVNTIGELFHNKKILMIVGILADKDAGKILEQFGKICDNFIATEPDHPGKLAASILGGKIRDRGGACVDLEDSSDALTLAMSKKREYDIILIAGSLYLIGKVRGELKSTN